MKKINLTKIKIAWSTNTRLRGKWRKALGRSRGRTVLRRRFNRFRSLYKKVDFVKAIWNIPAYILNVEYDAMRNAFVCLVIYRIGIISYILHCSGTKPGESIYSVASGEINLGYTTTLMNLRGGQVVHNVELFPGSGAVFSRSAGCFSLVLHNKDINFVSIRLSSKKIMKLSKYCLATLGALSNFKFKYRNYKNAGSVFNLGYKAAVRGVAMNPVDHPHGGGEGKKSKPRKTKSIW